MKVAIIGLGNIGKALATDLVKGKRSIIVASRDITDATNFSTGLEDLVQAKEIEDAVREADIIIPTIWFDAEKEFVQKYANELKGKIIIDVSNPIAPDENGGFKKIIDSNLSSGGIMSSLIGNNAKLVKTFGTLGASSLESEAHKTPKAVIFYATDHKEFKLVIEELINDSGFDALSVGGINQSIRIEVFGDLHEFGALGKPVTLEEAKEKI